MTCCPMLLSLNSVHYVENFITLRHQYKFVFTDLSIKMMNDLVSK